jgi:hypothetical protein
MPARTLATRCGGGSNDTPADDFIKDCGGIRLNPHLLTARLHPSTDRGGHVLHGQVCCIRARGLLGRLSGCSPNRPGLNIHEP